VTASREASDFADLDDEREVDLRKYWNALLARWWLPALGLVAGLIVGYIFTLGGNQVYEATSTLYLGQPYSQNSPIPGGLATNPAYVNQKIHSPLVARIASTASGMRTGDIHNNISSSTTGVTKGSAARTGAIPLVEITLTGAAPKKVQAALLSVSDQIINQLSGYVDTQITGYQELLTSLNAQIASNETRIADLKAALAGAGDLSPIDRLLIVTQLDNAIQQNGTLVQNKTLTQQQLSLAEDIQKPQYVDRPIPTKTTARSTRNSMLVGGAIGLIVGIIAALAWGPVARRISKEA
jgi:uncharacterized protein involved in exopolysaccharide biosynthesis